MTCQALLQNLGIVDLLAKMMGYTMLNQTDLGEHANRQGQWRCGVMRAKTAATMLCTPNFQQNTDGTGQTQLVMGACNSVAMCSCAMNRPGQVLSRCSLLLHAKMVPWDMVTRRSYG